MAVNTLLTTVVSYRNSTSNHNRAGDQIRVLRVVSYRNSTSNPPYANTTGLYLIEILHQTTTLQKPVNTFVGCILSKFYIKPQPATTTVNWEMVVSYRNSTSNHNYREAANPGRCVVSYRNSTSNHNNVLRVSTSSSLYLIEILHQTTTHRRRIL